MSALTAIAGGALGLIPRRRPRDAGLARLLQVAEEITRLADGRDRICQACLEQRPTDEITDVRRRFRVETAKGVRALYERVAYCADRPDCQSRAYDVSRLDADRGWVL